MVRFPMLTARRVWIAVFLIVVTLPLAVLPPALAQTGQSAAELQRKIGQIEAELDFYRAFRLDEPLMMSTSGQIYEAMTGHITASEVVTLSRDEMFRIATAYWAFAGEDYRAQGVTFEEFLNRLVAFSNELRGGLRAEVANLTGQRDALVLQLGQMQGPQVPQVQPPQGVASAQGWAGRWSLTRTQLTGHVSSIVGAEFKTTMRVSVGQDGSCTARIDGFDVVICRASGTHLSLESRGGWAGDMLMEFDRKAGRLTGTFYAVHPSSGESTGSFSGQRN